MRNVLTIALSVALLLPAMSFATPPRDLVEIRQQQLRQIRQQIKEISVDQLHKMNKKNASFILLDVREPNEYAISIKSTNGKKIPRGLIEWRSAKALDVDDEIIVYCRTGDRGAYATHTLQTLGYRNVRNVKGGIVGWMEAGYPIETYLGEVTPKNYRLPKK